MEILKTGGGCEENLLIFKQHQVASPQDPRHEADLRIQFHGNPEGTVKRGYAVLMSEPAAFA